MKHGRKDTSMLWNIIMAFSAIVGFFTQAAIATTLGLLFWLAWHDLKQQRKKRAEKAEIQRLLNMIDAAHAARENRDTAQRSDAFTRWYRVALQENPDLSLKESVVLFLEQELRSNSGQLEEDKN